MAVAFSLFSLLFQFLQRISVISISVFSFHRVKIRLDISTVFCSISFSVRCDKSFEQTQFSRQEVNRVTMIDVVTSVETYTLS